MSANEPSVFILLDQPNPVCSSTCDDESCLRCAQGDCGEDARGNVRVIAYIGSSEQARELLRQIVDALIDNEGESFELDLGVRTVTVDGLNSGAFFQPAYAEEADT